MFDSRRSRTRKYRFSALLAPFGCRLFAGLLVAVKISGGSWNTYITLLLLALGLGNRLLDLDLLNVVARLDVQDTVDVQASLELADHEVTLGVLLNALDGEATNPGVGLAGQLLRLGVLSLQVKSVLSVEGQDLGRGHDVALVEDCQVGVLIGDVLGLLPSELDGVVDHVVNGEVTDTEDGRKDSATESATTGDSLVCVEGERKLLAAEVLLNCGLEGRDTCAASYQLNVVNVLGCELSLSKRLLDRSSGALEKRLDELLELFTLEHTTNVNIVHDRLNVDGSHVVGRKDLLQLLNTSSQTEACLAVLHDVDLVLLVELLGEMLNKSLVDVATTEVAVPCARLYCELALLELNNGSCVVAVANVDEADPLGLLFCGRQIKLCDTVAKGDGSVVVDQPEAVKAGDLGSVEDGAALCVGVPDRAGQDDVVDGELELGGGGCAHAGQVHGCDLSGSELLLLAQVGNLSADLAVDVDQRRRDKVLLNLDIRVVERAAGEADE